MALLVLSLVVAAAALTFALTQALNTDPGWMVIEASTSELNCGSDFVFNYCFVGEGADATLPRKRLTEIYTDAVETAYLLFNKDVQTDRFHNLYDVNAAVNQPIEVHPVLYDAFELLNCYKNRGIFLAPVYVEYHRIFHCASPEEAMAYDPYQNPQLMPYITQLASFANDPDAISVQLLENNRVCLTVSEEYLAFAREYEIEQFLDFSWLKNGFIADYIAGTLEDNGFTNGYLTSYDGFTRNLDRRSERYSFNIFDRVANDIYRPAVMHYNQPMSLVYLRNYPMGDSDRWHYFGFSNGRIANLMIDPADGVDKAAQDSLVTYSSVYGCAELLLQMYPVYIADAFVPEQLATLAEKQVYSIWCHEQTLLFTERELKVELLEVAPGVSYTAEWFSVK